MRSQELKEAFDCNHDIDGLTTTQKIQMLLREYTGLSNKRVEVEMAVENVLSRLQELYYEKSHGCGVENRRHAGK